MSLLTIYETKPVSFTVRLTQLYLFKQLNTFKYNIFIKGPQAVELVRLVATYKYVRTMRTIYYKLFATFKPILPTVSGVTFF